MVNGSATDMQGSSSSNDAPLSHAEVTVLLILTGYMIDSIDIPFPLQKCVISHAKTA